MEKVILCPVRNYVRNDDISRADSAHKERVMHTKL